MLDMLAHDNDRRILAGIVGATIAIPAVVLGFSYLSGTDSTDANIESESNFQIQGVDELTDSLAIGEAGASQSTESNSLPEETMSTSFSSNEEKFNYYSSAPSELSSEELAGKKAIIKTTKGDIEIELFGDITPKTVSNFIFLANEGFYDTLTFHRREEGFVIQGGDPLGTGQGGPGYTVPAEFSTDAKAQHERGAVAMARLPDQVNPEQASSGSQFYITLDAANFLDGQYTVFGRVTSGLEIVDQIQVGDVIETVVIE